MSLLCIDRLLTSLEKVMVVINGSYMGAMIYRADLRGILINPSIRENIKYV